MSRITRRNVIPVNQVTPLTYRDGVTYIQLLTELSDYIKTVLHPSLQHTVDQLVADVETQMDKHHDQYVEGVQEFQRIHDAFMQDVNAHLIALNDTAVSDLVEDDSSLLGTLLRDVFTPQDEFANILGKTTGTIVVEPDSDDILNYETLQAACDRAFNEGKTVYATGRVETDQTLLVQCAADLSKVRYEYSGTTTAIQLGAPGGRYSNREFHSPRVNNTNKTQPGWDQVEGSIGIDARNVYACPNIHIRYVENFETGLRVFSDGPGNAYNTFYLGTLISNKVNQLLSSNDQGWTNQNTYIGGLFGIRADEGVKATGTRHIETIDYANNHTWINPSLEGAGIEYNVALGGGYNVILNGRFEGPDPVVFWKDNALSNTILFGYDTHRLTEVFGENVRWCSLMTGHQWNIRSGSAQGGINLTNEVGEIQRVLSAFPPDADMSELGAWTFGISSSLTRARAKDDTTGYRVGFDHETGSLMLGVGNNLPSAYFRAIQNRTIETNSNLHWSTHGTHNIGSRTAAPRQIFADYAIVTGDYTTDTRPNPGPSGVGVGGMIYDTTLNKPLWSDGVRFRDANGEIA